jgi:hypothetical protein
MDLVLFQQVRYVQVKYVYIICTILWPRHIIINLSSRFRAGKFGRIPYILSKA